MSDSGGTLKAPHVVQRCEFWTRWITFKDPPPHNKSNQWTNHGAVGEDDVVGICEQGDEYSYKVLKGI